MLSPKGGEFEGGPISIGERNECQRGRWDLNGVDSSLPPHPLQACKTSNRQPPPSGVSDGGLLSLSIKPSGIAACRLKSQPFPFSFFLIMQVLGLYFSMCICDISLAALILFSTPSPPQSHPLASIFLYSLSIFLSAELRWHTFPTDSDFLETN
ncbi:hypothetical protein SDJN02_18197, partial [Cucurbita argyrosperma subsp. argyrosperma]